MYRHNDLTEARIVFRNGVFKVLVGAHSFYYPPSAQIETPSGGVRLICDKYRCTAKVWFYKNLGESGMAKPDATTVHNCSTQGMLTRVEFF